MLGFYFSVVKRGFLILGCLYPRVLFSVGVRGGAFTGLK